MGPQWGALRVLAESLTVSLSTTIWRANILVSSTTENDTHKTTLGVLTHESAHNDMIYKSVLTQCYQGPLYLFVLSTAQLSTWPLLVKLVRKSIVGVCAYVVGAVPKLCLHVPDRASVCISVCVWMWLKGAVGVWFMAMAGHNQSFGWAVRHNMLCHTARIHASCWLHTPACSI